MDTLHQVKRTLVDTAKDAGDSIVDAAKYARDAVVDAKDAVFEATKDAKDKTFDVAQDAKDMVVKLADTVSCAVTGSKTDILDALKTDHELVASYFEQIVATSTGAYSLRDGLFGQLKYELEAHSAAEEKLFYPMLRKQHAAGATLTEAYTDHDLVKQLLFELTTQPVNSDDWMAQLRVLKENVERHVQMEEDELFAYAEKNLSGTQRADLGLRFQAEKQHFDGPDKAPKDRGARGHKASAKLSTKKPSRGHHHAAA